MKYLKVFENFDQDSENLSNVPPHSLEEQIEFCMKWYPTLYDQKYGRMKVLEQLYLTIGGGYEWWDGRLVCDDDPNTDKEMYDYRKREWEAQKEQLQREIERKESFLNRLKTIIDRTQGGAAEQRVLEEIQDQINSLEKELNTFNPYGEAYPNEKPLALKDISVYDSSNIFHIPSDVKPDYLEGAKEILKYILDQGYSGSNEYKLMELAEELGVI